MLGKASYNSHDSILIEGAKSVQSSQVRTWLLYSNHQHCKLVLLNTHHDVLSKAQAVHGETQGIHDILQSVLLGKHPSETMQTQPMI